MRRRKKKHSLLFDRPTREFLLIWRRHHCRWRTTHFDLCLALMAIKQWGFFNFLRMILFVNPCYPWYPHTQSYFVSSLVEICSVALKEILTGCQFFAISLQYLLKEEFNPSFYEIWMSYSQTCFFCYFVLISLEKGRGPSF